MYNTMQISYHSWILVALFAINLIFTLVMTIVSPFYKQMLASGWGMVMNIIWMVLIILLTGTYLFFNVSCLMSNGQCVALSWTTVAIVFILTAWIVVNSLIMDHRYRKTNGGNVKEVITSE
jgi:hypothetical protein